MMPKHLEFLVEELSMEAFLQNLLKRLLPSDCTFRIHVFQGKNDLLKNLEKRLRGYQRWLPPDFRIMVMVDRDADDCHELKAKLEAAADESGAAYALPGW